MKKPAYEPTVNIGLAGKLKINRMLNRKDSNDAAASFYQQSRKRSAL